MSEPRRESSRAEPGCVLLGDVPVGPGQPVLVIAEIGCNFQSTGEALPLIDAAIEAGADAVKIQTFEPETIASSRAVFDMANTGVVPQREIFRRYRIDASTHERLYEYARDNGVLLFSTPSHPHDLELLERLGNPVYKIGSDDSWNLPFLRATARLQKPVVLSTGMASLEEVRESVAAVRGEGNEQLVLLQCLSDYPAAAEDVNLRVIETFAREFPGVPIGYSDHTLGSLVCWGAVALGAKVIEKHFTLDKTADGPDHALSADPAELAELVAGIRTLELARGDGVKAPTPGELRNRPNNRKSLVATAPIPRGNVVSAAAIDVLRPGDGIAPKFLEEVVGLVATADIEADESLTWEKLERSP